MANIVWGFISFISCCGSAIERDLAQEVIVISTRVLHEVLLMIVFSGVKDTGRRKLGREFVCPCLGKLHFVHEYFRRLFLRISVIKNGRAVLRASIVALAVGGR